MVKIPSLFFFTVLSSLSSSNTFAQIVPDSSLGTENSVVNSQGNRDTINGGAIRNTNLFHSFQEFNVSAGREAYFANPNDIDNIFTRVTGNNVSNIQGVLGVLGNANLYLINPNGIVFGQNSRLDVNGSFFATTADSVLFDDGFEFSAANPNQPPLLNIDIPVGFRFRDNPKKIINQSSANDINTNDMSFSVPEGEINVVKSIRIEGFDQVYGETRINTSKLIAQNVCTQTVNSEFINVGKGGLPPNPDDVLTEGSLEVGLVAPVTREVGERGSRGATVQERGGLEILSAQSLRPNRKPPAQGWIWREDGTVELVAYNPQQEGEQRTWHNQKHCR